MIGECAIFHPRIGMGGILVYLLDSVFYCMNDYVNVYRDSRLCNRFVWIILICILQMSSRKGHYDEDIEREI